VLFLGLPDPSDRADILLKLGLANGLLLEEHAHNLPKNTSRATRSKGAAVTEGTDASSSSSLALAKALQELGLSETTAGFSGADLSSLLGTARLNAATRGDNAAAIAKDDAAADSGLSTVAVRDSESLSSSQSSTVAEAGAAASPSSGAVTVSDLWHAAKTMRASIGPEERLRYRNLYRGFPGQPSEPSSSSSSSSPPSLMSTSSSVSTANSSATTSVPRSRTAPNGSNGHGHAHAKKEDSTANDHSNSNGYDGDSDDNSNNGYHGGNAGTNTDPLDGGRPAVFHAAPATGHTLERALAPQLPLPSDNSTDGGDDACPSTQPNATLPKPPLERLRTATK